MLKKILITTVTIVILLVALGGLSINWLKGFIPSSAEMAIVKASQKQDVPYLQHPVLENRGKILAVVTSVDKMGTSGKNTGYELTELARAYWVFQTNGFEVDIASTKGGTPPIVLDDDDMREYDYAFLNDPEAQAKVTNTLLIDDINPADYEAVYFVGGKGAMFDFPDNAAIKNIVKYLYQNGKIVSAVCHGPAALVNVKLDNGQWFAANKNMSAFTNEEELFLIPDAETVFPFLLQDKLSEQGSNFKAGDLYLEQVIQDGQVLTGQNPWSVWKLSEDIIRALGYTPKVRVITPEENSVTLLAVYKELGYKQAKQHIQNHPVDYQEMLVLVHAVIAFMNFELSQGTDLLFLTDSLKAEV
ncbi:type 1 glutamine amidotransferase domain-containing protein [uncultured Paraglaciecola sp.]|uniref:type 1 glutamine amidotransferase domain-containing protein n=1 Tax=uncultured Paraglaciecola sp. TaxID=1765024 RepID=UPI0025EF3AB2|nr:type 1 glutamine amidotransferase domain-containing protein [uncultured Paraglaciecola sp.]